MKTNSIDLRR